MTEALEEADDGQQVMMRRAEESIANLLAAFDSENRRNVTTLRHLWNQSRLPNGHTGDLEPVFRVCHEIKGQGATFGYHLLSRVAASLCELLSNGAISSIPEGLGAAIEEHVAAIELITDNKMTGPEAGKGQDLLRRLRETRSLIARP